MSVKTPYKIYGQIEWLDYDYDIMWDASVYPETGRKFLLEVWENWMDLYIKDYVEQKKEEPNESEELFVPLQWEELVEYLVYYADRFKRETWKSFTKSLNAKINLSNKKTKKCVDVKKTTDDVEGVAKSKPAVKKKATQ